MNIFSLLIEFLAKIQSILQNNKFCQCIKEENIEKINVSIFN